MYPKRPHTYPDRILRPSLGRSSIWIASPYPLASSLTHTLAPLACLCQLDCIQFDTDDRRHCVDVVFCMTPTRRGAAPSFQNRAKKAISAGGSRNRCKRTNSERHSSSSLTLTPILIQISSRGRESCVEKYLFPHHD